jgi:hypothetical protein
VTWMQFFGEVLFTIGIVWAVAVAYFAVIGVIELVIMPIIEKKPPPFEGDGK